MGVIIRRKDNGEVFDLPLDFSLEINNTSPIFNDIGSKSVPASFPRNDHNSITLGYAHRMDIATKPTNEIAVIVSDGSYIREGMLFLNEASNTESTYSVTIAFNEGIMYNKMKSMKLHSLPNLPIDEREQPDMINYMNRLLVEDDLSHPLTVFPVWLKAQGKVKKTEQTPEGINIEREYTIIPVLNEVDINTKKLAAKDIVEHAEGDKPIPVSVPKGYGITPFVRLWYVLELVFTHFGYTIRDNPFKTEFQLRRLVVLNNTIDAIVENRIKYAQLMPNVTIFELFTSLFVRFGAKIFVDGNTNTVDIVLLRDILSSSPDVKLPVGAVPDIQYTEPKQLKLSAGKGLDKSNTETDTFEEFLAKYNNTLGINDEMFYYHGIHYYELHGVFYQTPVGELDGDNTTDLFYDKYKPISSFHFDWNKQTEGIDTEEYHSVDEGLTMFYGLGERLFYGIDYALRNSKLEVELKVSSAETENKLAFAFDMGEGYGAWNKDGWGYKFGTILPFSPDMKGKRPVYFVDKEGNQMKYALTFIGQDGCFEHFHKQYDAVLRHSNYVVKTKVDLPKFQLSNIKYQQMYNLHTQPMLIDKLNYILGDFNNKELTARTTRLYTPYDLEKEHGHPKPERIKYKWLLQNDKEDAVADLLASRIEHWKITPYPDIPSADVHTYEFIDCWIREGSIDDPNPPSDVNLWYLPPTDQQYASGLKIGITQHSSKIEFVVKFKYFADSGSGHGQEVTVERIDPFRNDFNYSGYFIPVEV